MPVTIHKTIEIQASAAQVWPYVGAEAGLRRWWGVDIALEAKQGGRCEERGVFQGKPYYLCGEVTVYAPPHQLELTLRQPSDGPAWPTFTTISIVLTEKEGYTLVTLCHQAFGALPTDPRPQQRTPYPPMSAPTRPLILNRLPASSSIAGVGVASPDIGRVQPGDGLATAWLHAQETRWGSSLSSLKQTSEVQRRKL